MQISINLALRGTITIGEAEPQDPILDGLEAAYNMEAATGNEPDAVNSFDLVEVGTVGSTTGKIGNARTFTVLADRFTTTQSGDFDFGDAFSISAWLNPTKTEATHHIIKGEDWELMIDADFLFWQGSEGTVNGDSVAPGSWYHVVFTYDNPVGTLYLNGSLTSSNSSQVTNPQHGALVIGANASGTQGFEGAMDMLYFWSRALVLAEVQQLFGAGNGLELP